MRDKLKHILSQFAGQQNIIAIPRVLIELTGDWTLAAMLNQLLYWSGQKEWIYKSLDDWIDEVGCVTRYKMDQLKEFEYVETEVRKANGVPTTHYRINWDILERELIKCISDDPKIDKNNPEVLKTEVPSSENRSSLTEITTEITTEIKRLKHADKSAGGELTETKDPIKGKDIVDGMLYFGKKARDRPVNTDIIQDYPPDTQQAVRTFSELWKIPPPPRVSRSFGLWIKVAREMTRSCNELGADIGDVLKELYYTWSTPEDAKTDRATFQGRYPIYGIQSIQNVYWRSLGDVVAGTTRRRTKTYYDADGNEIEREI